MIALDRPKRLWPLLIAAVALLVPATAAMAAEAAGEPEPGLTHRMMLLAMQLGLILVSARLGNILFEKFKMPGVLGELAAGMIIGPYALGQLGFLDFHHGLFPLYQTATGTFPVSPELYGLASVAAIVLLFIVGLETDIRMFLQYSVAGTLVGIGGVAVSFVLGDLTAVLFGASLFGRKLGFFDPESLFLGVISTATSVGITARILSEKRQMNSPEGVTILAGAVVDDVLGIIMLAIVTGMVAASRATGAVDWGHIGVIAAKAVGVWLVATVVGLLASRKISVLLKLFRSRSSIAIMALGFALVLAGLFEEAGLAMIIGAYIMGLSLSRADISHVVRERIHPIYEFLVPIFFCVMGMLINFKALANPAVLVFGGVYTVVALAAKIIGCGGPALLLNFNLRGALRVGTGMIPRGEVALIIAGIGLAAGTLNEEVFAAAIVMTVISTVIAPPGLVALFRNPASGMRKTSEPRGAVSTLTPFTFPSSEVCEFMVTKLSHVFETEGYFVHRISHEDGVYQLRKDDAIIDFIVSDDTITFDCLPRYTPLINTAVFEAIAEMEQSLKGLRQSADAAKVGAAILDRTGGDTRGFRLTNYVTPATVEPHLQAADKSEAIEKLLELAWRTGKVRSLEAARQSVWAREESMSTGLQYGVAIPHGRTEAVDDIVCAIGICHAGVDFGSLDGEPSTIFILTLSPSDKPAPHIQFMSTISQLLDEPGRAALLAAATGEELMAAVSRKPTQAPAPASKPPPRTTAAPAAEPVFDLGKYVRPDLVQPNLRGTGRDEIIDELLDLLKDGGLLPDAQAAREAIRRREDQMPTALEYGVCVPHGRTDSIDDLVCAVGIHHQGVDFGAIDGQPSKIFVLTLVPEDKPGPYMQFMAMIVRVLDEQGRQRVLAAETPEALQAAMIALPGA